MSDWVNDNIRDAIKDCAAATIVSVHRGTQHESITYMHGVCVGALMADPDFENTDADNARGRELYAMLKEAIYEVTDQLHEEVMETWCHD